MVNKRYCDVHRVRSRHLRGAARPLRSPPFPAAQNLLQLMLHHGFMSEAEMLAQCRACVEAHAQDAKANKVNVSGSDEAQLEKARKILLEEISARRRCPCARARCSDRLQVAAASSPSPPRAARQARSSSRSG